ncbi:tRNA uridine-5-carboxymethylaminomethyl(34) synthesis GTPase MnmE [Paracoccus versutus]|uniref:tRNA modification GTPase MnmE n=1 Tax=Paracoccus versutus TaxID=34007 RepID=A0AAQ0HLA0_PARVE|nr:tRNA uridine-5-carboxymethylaminomethyl(34) synthesis GTPase MnmE [Paracoccus versutus]KGJ10901.1 tRNA modification GTPase TrmE [Paracoccus versutus]REG55500.1 tRNA modification GTPase [Paracoccus versutus]WEJ78418.1 tRNA uridine-5-carboxymethylaminomethyl(34) synthesis GTPase MnmE [Paracoccus versutus]
MDTIFAEATPPGRGGVSVVRLSGPKARATLESLAGPVATPRLAALRALRDGEDLIDRALVLWFEEGHSFTGEEVAELHLHGAPVIANRLAQALLSRGLRRAEAGEFSKRAFLNGRMDLAEAEGLADLLSAETEAQRKLAMRATEGELGRKADELRVKLVRAGALIEASIDFADEEVPEEVPPEALDLIAAVRADIRLMLAGYPATERLRQGYVVAIVGPPNAGKSTLLNRIGQRDIALVSEVAGTTRDILELHTDLRGLPVTFLDTAGLRESSDPIEAMGVARGLQRAAEADLRIHLTVDGIADAATAGDIVVRAKADLGRAEGISISGLTGEGVAELLDLVYDRLRVRAADTGLVGHKRQAEALQRALSALEVDHDMAPEFLAEALRQAAQALAMMVGRVGAEDYLDEIFSSFCIGK